MEIALTKEELSDLITEGVKKILLEYGLISEMAASIKDYSRRVEGLLPQIAENWCLIYFFKTTGLPTRYIEHWGIELSAHIKTLARTRLKSGDKQDVLYKCWNIEDFDTNPENVFLCIEGKFRKEQIDTRKYYGSIMDTCKAFVYSTRDIVTAICSRSVSKIDQYIENIGNNKIIYE